MIASAKVHSRPKMSKISIWIKYKAEPIEIDFQGGNVNKLKKLIQTELHNKLSKFDIDEITLRVPGKEENLRADMTIDKNFITSYEEPVYVEVANTGKL
jgi:hypothetical protein